MLRHHGTEAGFSCSFLRFVGRGVLFTRELAVAVLGSAYHGPRGLPVPCLWPPMTAGDRSPDAYFAVFRPRP